jgi:hypothetical protein
MRRIIWLLVFLPVIAVQGGCISRWFAGEPTVKGAKGKIAVSALEPLVDGFAERQVTLIADACEAIKRETTIPGERRMAHRIKLYNATAVYDVVTMPDPLARLSNLYLLVELEYLVWVEEGVAVKRLGERGRTRMVPALKEARSEMSMLADLAMKPEQKRKFNELIREWRAKNPDVEFIAGIRFGALLESSGKTILQSATSVFDIIDPVAGTSESVEGARLVADRAFFYSKRLLKLADWQVEAGLENVLALPDVQAIPTEAKGVVDHFFLRLAAVIGFFFVVLILYRVVAVRWLGPRPAPRRPPTTWESRYGSPT